MADNKRIFLNMFWDGDSYKRQGDGNVAEGLFGASRADFINKYTIALKEANETRYWLELLTETDYLPDCDQTVSSANRLLQSWPPLSKLQKEKNEPVHTFSFFIFTFYFSKERGAADIAAVWLDNGDADTLRDGLLYHRNYVSGA